ncbi:hypothetical protein FF100_29320 [Methylobacterium terricola]|uniref:Uncharacterized protein n=1 Tax=Methylobacterium terricola TaxID=2583531 RepID=A0A5C4L8F4_9HYPH|nr:hypothetical protein [Methylobacterium terricola]TNC08442.1 hypothetical protein FF100_29320 [Methylobacterium terricola]
MSRFRSMPIFRPGIVGVFTMGADAVILTKAMKKVPEASEAARALGDPFNRARRERALRILEALPARRQARILAEYDRKRRDGGDE